MAMAAGATSALAFAATTANAATVYASDVDWANNGTVGTSNDRDDATNALGAPDGAFLSLGLSDVGYTNPGFAVFSFDGMTFGAGSTTTAYEVTFNCSVRPSGACSYPESLAVLYGTDYAFGTHDAADLADFTYAGQLFNADAQSGASLIIPGTFTYIALVDTTLMNFPNSQSTDGFDVDAVGVSPVPVPAALPLMAGGLALGGMARRRAKKAKA
ncbi:putative porin [Parvularcula dongshanensis]|uniref:Putative porin n=2 Tax=Parvularcula dongshanensis TaxID=1173995 RepID=A0A840I1L9_9PROT|nr:putative porin [Parvularcula dongshanensis]